MMKMSLMHVTVFTTKQHARYSGEFLFQNKTEKNHPAWLQSTAVRDGTLYRKVLWWYHL